MKLHVEVVAFLFYFPHKPHKTLSLSSKGRIIFYARYKFGFVKKKGLAVLIDNVQVLPRLKWWL